MPLRFGRVRLAVRPRTDAGNAPEGARKMRRITVTEQARYIGHFDGRFLQQPAGGTKTRMLKHLGIAGVHVREPTL